MTGQMPLVLCFLRFIGIPLKAEFATVKMSPCNRIIRNILVVRFTYLIRTYAKLSQLGGNNDAGFA